MAGMEWQQRYRDRFYSAASGYVDGMTEFYRLCASVIPIGSRILEIGSGPSNPTSRFLQTLGHVTGVDVDPEVRTNDALGAALVMSDETYPVPNDSFDACVSDYVIEHLSDPLRHLQEVRRVLKPNGAYVFRTPNSLHYVTIASRLTPHWFHKLVANRLRNLPPGTHDPYPTRYRLNSRSRIRLTAACAHLDVETLRLIEKDPWYGRSSRALFLCFMLYERLVNSHDVFAPFRVNLLGILRKREE